MTNLIKYDKKSPVVELWLIMKNLCLTKHEYKLGYQFARVLLYFDFMFVTPTILQLNYMSCRIFNRKIRLDLTCIYIQNYIVIERHFFLFSFSFNFAFIRDMMQETMNDKLRVTICMQQSDYDKTRVVSCCFEICLGKERSLRRCWCLKTLCK